jgi:hypothetical protein
MTPTVRRFAAVFAVVSLAAGGAAFAQACESSNPVTLPPEPDGSTQNEEASADAPVAETGGGDTSTMDGPVVGDGGAGDSGDAAQDAPPGDAPADAPSDAPMMVDAQALCASLCDAGTCTNGTCGIDCSMPNTCGGAVTCPAGIPCTVNCAGNNGCAGGVDCTQASTCDITCSGNHSCAGKLHCGGQSCTIDCSGMQSCAGGACCDAGSCMLTGVTSMCP